MIAAYTDLVIGWSTDAGVEFYLRDCAFNRGPKGATRILQRAVGVQDDGEIGPQTCSAVADIGSEQLLVRLRVARDSMSATSSTGMRPVNSGADLSTVGTMHSRLPASSVRRRPRAMSPLRRRLRPLRAGSAHSSPQCSHGSANGS